MSRAATKVSDRILDAAFRVMAEQGYAGASVQRIVDESGITKPALYYYFKSKAGLHEALVERAFDERMALVRNAAESHGSIEDQLVAIFDATSLFAKKRRDLMRICFATAFSAPGEIPSRPRCLQKGREQFEFVHSLICAAIKRGELDRKFDSTDLTASIYSQLLIRSMALVMNDKGPFEGGSSRKIVQLYLFGAAGKKQKRK